MRFAEGWIKVYRALEDHWIAQDAEYFRAWVLLLMKANFGKRSRVFNGKLVDVKPGELIGSNEYFAKALRLTPARCRTFLKLLRDDQMVSIETTRKGTKLTINNYETYQDSQQTENSLATNKKHTGNSLATHWQHTGNNTIRIQEGKEGKELRLIAESENEKSSDEPRKQRSKFTKPTLQEVEQYAETRQWLKAEANAFYDYQEASGWKVGNKPMKNWQAAMRTWESKLPPRPKKVYAYFLTKMRDEGEYAALMEFEKFYGHYEKQDWRTGAGQKVTNFEPLADQWIGKKRAEG